MSNLDVFREVDEDYRRDRMAAFWKRYGLAFAVAVVLALIIAGGIQYYFSQVQAEKAAQTSQLEALMSEAQPGSEAKVADELVSYASRVDESHAVLARIMAASLRQHAGQLDAAAALYHQIADGPGEDQSLKDLAVVRLGYLAVDQPNPEPLIPRLQALIAKNSPWRYSAREAIALLTAKAGKREEAAKMLTDLANDAGAPQDIVGRARALADLYSGQ